MAISDEQPQLLLVEDGDTSIELISRHLGAKYQIVHVRTAQDARKRLSAAARIHIAVIDIKILRAQEFELLRRIRDTESLADLAIIALRGPADNADCAAAFENGVNDFLHHPLDPVELQARINTHQMLAATLRKLEVEKQSSREQSTTDPLTQLTNRRSLLEQGRRYMALALRNQKDLSVVSLDIDKLKQINETYGNAVGNQVLSHLGKLLREAVRTEDVPARVGGEEFAVLLPNADAVGAATFAERLRIAIEQSRLAINGQSLSFTVSLGSASLRDDGGESVEQLLMVADRRLLLAKQNGRNRVVTRNEEPLKRSAR